MGSSCVRIVIGGDRILSFSHVGWQGKKECFSLIIYQISLLNMDINKLVDVLRATLQPDQREQAEKQLSEVW